VSRTKDAEDKALCKAECPSQRLFAYAPRQDYFFTNTKSDWMYMLPIV
jgi:heterodisulfide reductase subunit C